MREPNYSHWYRLGIVGTIRHLREADVQNDVDLIRAILEQVQAREDVRPKAVQLHDREPVLVARHVERLYNDGMLEGVRHRSVSSTGAALVLVTDLTTEGHNLLAAMQSRDVMERLKSALSPTEIASLPIRRLAAIALELAERAIRKKLDLE